jgi:hypothetical protein
MILYADTSLLISYYINDSNSVSAQAILQRPTLCHSPDCIAWK